MHKTHHNSKGTIFIGPHEEDPKKVLLSLEGRSIIVPANLLIDLILQRNLLGQSQITFEEG
jgi:hypothetical protein